MEFQLETATMQEEGNKVLEVSSISNLVKTDRVSNPEVIAQRVESSIDQYVNDHDVKEVIVFQPQETFYKNDSENPRLYTEERSETGKESIAINQNGSQRMQTAVEIEQSVPNSAVSKSKTTKTQDILYLNLGYPFYCAIIYTNITFSFFGAAFLEIPFTSFSDNVKNRLKKRESAFLQSFAKQFFDYVCGFMGIETISLKMSLMGRLKVWNSFFNQKLREQLKNRSAELAKFMKELSALGISPQEWVSLFVEFVINFDPLQFLENTEMGSEDRHICHALSRILQLGMKSLKEKLNNNDGPYLKKLKLLNISGPIFKLKFWTNLPKFDKKLQNIPVELQQNNNTNLNDPLLDIQEEEEVFGNLAPFEDTARLLQEDRLQVIGEFDPVPQFETQRNEVEQTPAIEEPMHQQYLEPLANPFDFAMGEYHE